VSIRSDFDVFLSHNSKDKPIVRELKQALTARKLTVWFDEDELRPGLAWQPLLEQGLQTAGSVVVAVGSSGIGPWQDEETQMALNLANALRRPVIPVLLPNCPEETVLNGFLLNRTWVDLRGGFSDEGIARLVWGITGEKPSRIESERPVAPPAATKWILVAGSGGLTPRPAKIDEVSRRLGMALAAAGFSLVTGGWNGVDHDVARAFVERIQQNGQSLSGRLVQVMQEGATPDFPAGRLVSGGSDDEAWRRSIERADMTTRVLGVRAASLLALPAGATEEFAEVQWMGVLRSLSALQMYQRATRGPIIGSAVVRFLLFDHRFPRSVAGCLAEIRASTLRMPSHTTVLGTVESVDRALRRSRPAADDGVALDAAMDGVQLALGRLNDVMHEQYVVH